MKGWLTVDLWDKFFASGKILDYLKYAEHKRGADDADAEGSDSKGKKYR
jgi:hypothetical protein